MVVRIENCQGGYLVEVQVDRQDPTYLVMPGQTDFKMVCVEFAEVEAQVRQLFQPHHGKIPVVEDHGQSS